MKKKASTSTWLIVSFIVTSFAGFLDSLYLSISYVRRIAPNCAILDGCDVVTASHYSTVGPAPLAFIGLFYYLVLLFMSLAYFTSGNEKLMKLDFYLTSLGFLASLYFVYLQVFVIEALCLYCMFSALTSTLLFIFAIMILREGFNN